MRASELEETIDVDEFLEGVIEEIPEGYYQCFRCFKVKSINDYYSSSISARKYLCKICNDAETKKWQERNPIRCKLIGFKSVTGISVTEKEYLTRLEEQNNKCSLCGELLLNDSSDCLDHCHFTRKIRGIIHSNCNVIIGLAKDDINLLQKAIAYLEKHKCSNTE